MRCQKCPGGGYYSFYPMFLFLLGASLTFSAALLATVVFSDGALVALRTAAEIIGWLLLLATVVGVAGLRRANPGRMCAASVTLCSGLAVLYMSYFFEWKEPPRPETRHHFVAAESASIRPVAYTYKTIEPLARPSVFALPAEAEKIVKASKLEPVASTRAALGGPSDTCSTLTGVESLQCSRCSEERTFSWLMCQERVRLDYCNSEAGDERTCPSPIPQSHPG